MVSFTNTPKPTCSLRPAYQLSWFQRLQETWALELLGILFSAAGLIAILTILVKYDGKERPTWSISINAVVSILSAVVSIGALYSVTHGVGQLKWVWLSEKERNLADIQIFDNGSKGVMGALALLFHLRARHFAALGAVAIVLRIGVDPFIQNVVHFKNGEIVDETQVSYAARTSLYREKGPEVANRVMGINPALKGSIYSAIYGSTRNGAQNPQYSCPTGNCTWDRFATFAYCPRCIDVSEHLNHTCQTMITKPSMIQACDVSFPSGSPYLRYTASEIAYSYVVSSYFSVRSARSSIALNTSGNVGISYRNTLPIWHSLRADVSAATVNRLDMSNKLRNDTRMIATECMMLPCILNIDAAVKDGSYEERIVDRYYLSNISASGELVAPLWGEEKEVRFGETFGMTPDAYDSAAVSFVNLTGTVTEADGGLGIDFGSDEIQAIFSAEYTNETCETPHDNFACVFNAIGRAMTKTVRDVSMPINGSRMPDAAVGKAFRATTFLRVEWMWLSLPATVWVISLVVWLGTIWTSSRVSAPLWRDNVLPLLFLLPENQETISIARGNFGSSSTGQMMRAEQMNVKLVQSGGRFMLVNS